MILVFETFTQNNISYFCSERAKEKQSFQLKPQQIINDTLLKLAYKERLLKEQNTVFGLQYETKCVSNP